MLRMLAATVLAMATLAAATADASEAAIRKMVQSRFPDVPVESVTRMPVGGLYEVVLDGRILYTDEKASYLFIGNLLELRAGGERDITRERTAQLNAQALRRSTDNAIKRVRGSGKRVIYTFEDPNCGYCHKLQKELLKLNDVTIYTFLWPILSQDSVEKSRAVWCSRDRAKAWDDLMSNNVMPPPGKCDAPLKNNIELAQRFGARGTPAIFLADGSMLPGFMPAEKLEQALNSVK